MIADSLATTLPEFGRVLADACREAEARHLDLLLYTVSLAVRLTCSALTIATYRVEYCNIVDVDLSVKRSRCGGRPWSLVFPYGHSWQPAYLRQVVVAV